MKKFRKLYTFASTAVVVLMLISCTTTTNSLPSTDALTNDPVMTKNFENVENLEWTLTEKDHENFGAERTHLTRCLGFNSDVEADDLMMDVLAYAQTKGWSHPEEGILDTNSSLVAFKKDKFGDPMTMIVAADGYACEANGFWEGYDNTLRISITY